ncbi:MAG: hypothetical protein H6Q73_2775 [Firmicutes bacterium]|nr:hypothetical protein [Bacillota bacterium]
MKHTFIFLPGTWNVNGKYYDINGNETLVQGESVIIHSDNLWLNKGYMKLLGDEPIEIRNQYEIIPFQQDFTTWESFNPSIGRLTGRFMVVDDTIISLCVSEDGNYSGSECMIKVSDMLYKSRGFAFKDNEKLSSWSVELTKAN